MARRLGELLVAKGKLTDDQLRKALQAQMIWGGHLGTNLIELGYLSEDELGEVLAEAHSVRYAPYGMLQEIPAAVLSSIPRGLVEKYKIIPFRFDGKKLHLVMLTPQDLMALDEVAFATGFQLVPYVTPEIRLFQVLEKYYSIPRAKRYITLSRELSLRGLGAASEKGSPTSRPRADAPRPAPDILSAPPDGPAPASIDIAPEPSGLDGDDEMTSYATTAANEWSPHPAAGNARQGETPQSELVPEPIDESQSRDRSIDRVLRSQTLEEVCSSLIEVAAETFRRCVVFARMGDALVPVAGLSASSPVWSVEGLILPFTLSALEALFAGGRSYYLGPPPGGAHENEFYTRMGEGIPPNAFLAPVRLSE